MTRKKLFIIIAAIITLLLSIAAFSVAFRISSSDSVKEQLENEIAQIKFGNVELDSRIGKLNNDIAEIETELSSKTTFNNYYMEYKKTHDALNDEIAQLKEESASLDAQLEEKQAELDSASSIKNGTRGKSYALKKGETYSCPDKIPAGRYTVSGSGSFTVTNSSGKVRLSQNLDVAFDNSYTFNLSEKERINVTGDVTITEIK